MPKYIFRNGQIHIDKSVYMPVIYPPKTDCLYPKSAVVMIVIMNPIAGLSIHNQQENKYHDRPRYK